jgi:hypothetical protein
VFPRTGLNLERGKSLTHARNLTLVSRRSRPYAVAIPMERVVMFISVTINEIWIGELVY